MGTTLTGTTPQDTYDSLIKVTDNGPLTGSLKKLTDGLGNDSSLSLSTTAASLSGTLAVTGATTLSSTLVAQGTGSNTVLAGTGLKVRFNDSLYLNFSPSATGGNVGEIASSENGLRIVAAGSGVNSMTFLTSNSSGVSTERMRLDGAGNVGIGTAAPASLLHISQAAADTTFRIGNNSTYDQFIYFNGNNDWSLGMDYSNSNAFVLSNASTVGTNNRLVVTTAGNVGIGTSTPSAKLDVDGISVLSGAYHYQGAGTFRKQFIQGSVTAAASGSPVKLFTSGFSSVANVKVAARQSTSSIGIAEIVVTSAYGSSNPATVSSEAYVNNVTDILLAYNNSGYQIDVTVTYTGAAPTIHFYAEGISEASWTL